MSNPTTRSPGLIGAGMACFAAGLMAWLTHKIHHSGPATVIDARTGQPMVQTTGVWPWRHDGQPVTKSLQMYRGICVLLWIVAVAVFLLTGFLTGRWEIVWTILLAAAFLHTVLWVVSIGRQR
ncbi:MAG: hypothetical protein FWD63_01410 [Propionibacteriaceae bacterium]|nr:hypothetical protein [Propionibacteriaceae bacterium]